MIVPSGGGEGVVCSQRRRYELVIELRRDRERPKAARVIARSHLRPRHWRPSWPPISNGFSNVLVFCDGGRERSGERLEVRKEDFARLDPLSGCSLSANERSLSFLAAVPATRSHCTRRWRDYAGYWITWWTVYSQYYLPAMQDLQHEEAFKR